MSKKTTNILGIVIAIIAGSYFNIILCTTCTPENEDISSTETTKIADKNSAIAKEKQYINVP